MTVEQIQKALKIVPCIGDALSIGAELAEENIQLKRELAALKLIATLPSDRVTLQLGKKVAELEERVRSLRRRIKELHRSQNGNRGDVKGKGKAQEPIDDAQLQIIDSDRITVLAIALTKGASPAEIAGKLLDEVDRASMGQLQTPNEELVFSFPDRQSDHCDERMFSEPLGGRMNEIEGVLDTTLGRVARLEDEVRGLKM